MDYDFKDFLWLNVTVQISRMLFTALNVYILIYKLNYLST